MKPSIFIYFFFFLASPEVLWAQIVIDQSDMPKPGDTLRVSLTTSIPGNYSQTGSGITWDFSMLQPMNQRVDTFVDASVTPQEYWVYFIPGLISNLASPKGNNEFFPGVPVSQTYLFYKNSIEAFVDNGFAFKIQGYAFPVRYDIPDKYYVFPLDTNNTWASTSDFAFQFPGLFFFSTHRIRSSFVDGWGTVITPFGSFQSLRIRSDLVQHDSIFIDSLGFGIGLTRNVTEYKWLAENRGIPVLQINTEGLLITATYLDSARLPSTPLSLSLGPDTTVNKGDTITLQATVSGGVPPYRFVWSTMDTSQSLTVTMDTTRSFEVVVIDGLNQFASDQKVVTVISPGIEEPEVSLLRIFPNPSNGRIHLSMPGKTVQGTLSLFNSSGKEILKKEMKATTDIAEVDLSHLPKGAYLIRLVTKEKTLQGKVILLNQQ